MGKNLGTMYIYKHEGSDCSNGGISSKYDEVILWSCEDSEAPENAVVYVDRVLFGKAAPYLKPVNPPKGLVGPMYGGCICYTSNGAVPHNGEMLKLHDRYETQELYNKLTV